MTRSSFSLKALLVAAALSLPALAAAAEPAMAKGGMLVDHHGMTLYTFDKDTAGKSVCNGDPCETNWPPLAATAMDKASGKWSVIKRDDGKLQWAYDGKPLYTFKADKKDGDMTGDGKGGVWHVAKP
ncbi:Predicted lipoprotein with conserved Yx(FWY)xxD motif [Pseudomonas asplenii]|uniref:Predicted lipoprotein with conserved Yx(FWY)xxD motif n=1 Tax=Pseudomonas asplenii TaxID=53407 RepID=A0A1H1S6V6_9PSED|nr:hypothetical protein [Pseudomonas asplenii]SDS43717.1 Predicted lipoprotein with conserved Yx(FWY)xxD motif [Pseudomonas asplenii]